MDLERESHRSQAVTLTARRRALTRESTLLLVAVGVAALIVSVVLRPMNTIRLLTDESRLQGQAEGLTVLANAQRQALALQNTIERAGPVDLEALDTRLGLLLQQTRVMAIDSDGEPDEESILAGVLARLSEIGALRDGLALAPDEHAQPRLAAAMAVASLDRGVKRLYDIEEREVFTSVEEDAQARQQSQVALVILSVLTLASAAALVVVKQRRARSNVAQAYRELSPRCRNERAPKSASRWRSSSRRPVR